MTTATNTTTTDREYESFRLRVHARLMEHANAPLFTTDVDNLYDSFLEALPPAWRQHHVCNACRRFVNTFGSLVTIDEHGKAHSALWNVDDAPAFYRASVKAMLHALKDAKVTGVFYSSASTWGTPITGEWTHFGGSSPAVFHHLTQSASQTMAEKREDYGTIQRALADFSIPMLTTAVGLLQSEALYRSERVLGPAQWLLDLATAREAARKPQRDLLTWRAVALAPAGFCHPRSSMIGTLLEDIAAGLPFDDVSRRFAAKMHPLQYQRPQAAPTAGNIAQAEKIIEQLNAKHALARRFARFDEIETLWKPPIRPPASPTGEGVFAHLLPKAQKSQQTINLPATKMTWEKFQRTVLPTAERIEYYTTRGLDSFVALVTAADPDAPLIFQWNNPVSLYVYHNGSFARHWNLPEGTFVTVTGVTLRPSQWGTSPLTHQGEGAILLLDGAKDTRYENAGAALFPETLRAEFHSIRATIEAFSQRATIQGFDESSACGVILSKGKGWNARLRVTTTTGMVAEYDLDRWD